MARRLRLGSGIDVLNAWTDAAREADVKAVADALFAIVERSVYREYPVIDDSTVALIGLLVAFTVVSAYAGMPIASAGG